MAGEGQRARSGELGETGNLSPGECEADVAIGIVQILRQAIGTEHVVQEGPEVGGRVEVAERLGERAAAHGAQRRQVVRSGIAVGDHPKPAKLGQLGATTPSTLKRAPISSGVGKAAVGGGKSIALLRVGPGKRGGPSGEAKSGEPLALVDRASHMEAGFGRGKGEGAEIDMGGEIAGARPVERIGIGVGAHRLERVAVTGAVVAVIDREQRAALRGEAAGEGAGRSRRRWGEARPPRPGRRRGARPAPRHRR